MREWAILEDDVEMRGHKRPANHHTGSGPSCDDATNCEWCFELVTSAEAKGLKFMTFQKFLALTYPMLLEKDEWLPTSYLNPSTHTTRPKYMDPMRQHIMTFEVTWNKGGCEGGSCWGSEAEPFEGDDEPEDHWALEFIIERVFPQLNFKDYNSIKCEISNEEQIIHNDYYGNYHTEGIKGFSVKDLYEALVKRGYGK